jgi:hypothetical protein
MGLNLQTILLIMLIIIAIIYLYSGYMRYIQYENFETYSYGPFNYMDTGADPLSFYKYPIYRNPFMYPYKFYSSYPYPYMTYNTTNI